MKFFISSLTYLFKFITSSKYAWQIYDHLKIPGFGINLIRLYFPLYNNSIISQTFSTQFEQQIINIFNKINYDILIEKTAAHYPQIMAYSKNEVNEKMPYLNNTFYGIVDAAVLFSIIDSYHPKKILEIGSGISTRFMRSILSKHNLDTKIICVDPFPRVNISAVVDEIIPKPLEDAIVEITSILDEGDILFLDGSHYVFQGNDTTLFFFKLLPEIPKGVIIHIHDIFLPYDYPELVSRQLWSEQYLLGCLLMGGFKGFRVLFPTYFLCKRNKTLKQNISKLINTESAPEYHGLREGYSFWFIKE